MLLTVSDATTALPASVPSKGVTVQTTRSLVAKLPADKVALVPAAMPLTVQAKVLASASPSGSE